MGSISYYNVYIITKLCNKYRCDILQQAIGNRRKEESGKTKEDNYNLESPIIYSASQSNRMQKLIVEFSSSNNQIINANKFYAWILIDKSDKVEERHGTKIMSEPDKYVYVNHIQNFFIGAYTLKKSLNASDSFVTPNPLACICHHFNARKEFKSSERNPSRVYIKQSDELSI